MYQFFIIVIFSCREIIIVFSKVDFFHILGIFMILLKTLFTAGDRGVRKCIEHSFCRFNLKIPCDRITCCHFPTFFMVRKISCISKNMQDHKVFDPVKSTRQIKNFNHTRPPCTSEEEKIIKQYKAYYHGKSKDNFNDALFVLGPMGSGKTTVIKSRIMTNEKYEKYAYVDTDELMAHLPGFDENSIDLFYPIARRMAIELTDWLLEKQLSFVAEGTCVKYQELVDYMIRLKEKGYNINVCKINNFSLDLVLHRASNRVHRKVRPELVREIYLQSNFGIKELYHQNTVEKIFENVNADEF